MAHHDLYVRAHSEDDDEVFVEVLAGSELAFPFMASWAPSCSWIGGSWLLTTDEWDELEARSLDTEEVSFQHDA